MSSPPVATLLVTSIHRILISNRWVRQVSNKVTVQTADVSLNDAAVVQLRISGRVEDSKVYSTLNSMNTNQALNMFQEASSMVDSRHLNPSSDELRTQTGLKQLAAALENAQFKQRAGVRVQGSALEAVRQQLLRVSETVKVNNRRDSQQMMQFAADYLQRSTE